MIAFMIAFVLIAFYALLALCLFGNWQRAQARRKRAQVNGWIDRVEQDMHRAHIPMTGGKR